MSKKWMESKRYKEKGWLSGGPQKRDEKAYLKRRSWHKKEHGGTKEEEE